MVVKFARANAAAYDDDGYMVNAFDKGATDSGMLARILPAITDELWKRGYGNEGLAKICGGNKMRVYQQVWEGVSPAQHLEDLEERIKLRNDLRERYMSRKFRIVQASPAIRYHVITRPSGRLFLVCLTAAPGRFQPVTPLKTTLVEQLLSAQKRNTAFCNYV